MGAHISTIRETYPPKSNFHPNDIPDLTGKVMLITGGSAGIGRGTAKALLERNAKVYIASYNEAKGAQTVEELKQETGREAIFIKLDLADLLSCKSAAEEFLRREKELHVLFNNAGVYAAPLDRYTVQGYDLMFGVHVLGHFYFTQLLMPALLVGAKSSPDGKARIVNVSSSASHVVNTIDFNVLTDTPARKKIMGYGLHQLYGQSKLGIILLSNELACRYGDQGIVSLSLNPGNIKTEIWRNLNLSNFGMYIMGLILLYDPEYGPLTQLYAGTAPEAAKLNGKYLIPWARVGAPGPGADDAVLAKALWLWLEEQVAKNAK